MRKGALRFVIAPYPKWIAPYAVSQFDAEDRKVAKAVLESLILKHNAKRAFFTQ